MSVATQITRIQGAKADLKTSIEAKGVTVPSATLISGYAALVDQIQSGGIPDSDGLVDLSISTGNQSGVSSFILEYVPQYLLKYTPSSAVSSVGGFTIPQTAVTYPNVVWSCNKPALTISGNTVSVPGGFSSSVVFTATWTDLLGASRTTTKTISVSRIAYVMTYVGYANAYNRSYFVTDEYPNNLIDERNLNPISFEQYGGHYIVLGDGRYIATGSSGWFKALTSDGQTAAIFSTSDAAKAAIDSM